MIMNEVDPITERELEILSLISEGASDREIAAKLYLSVNTVKWHNRQIYAKLGVTSRTQAAALAAEKGFLDECSLDAKPIFTEKKHNLPAQVSSFVGREREIKEIRELIQAHRLLTLTGPGGVGKTRLALEVARSLWEEEGYSDGIFFIELAPVLQPERVETLIVESLQLSLIPDEVPVETLTRFLGDQEVLLLMDNFEHLLEAAPLIGDLLSAASGLQILCTSRESLQLSGEQLYPVQPLAIHPSQQLFIQRACEVNPSFDPAEDELTLIDKICAQPGSSAPSCGAGGCPHELVFS